MWLFMIVRRFVNGWFGCDFWVIWILGEYIYYFMQFSDGDLFWCGGLINGIEGYC